MYMNTPSEHAYFSISKNIISYAFLLVFKVVESLQCILKQHSRKSLLRLIYSDYELSFDRMLKDNKQKSKHQKKLSLAIEIYNFQAELAPSTMSELFVTRKNNYNLRNFQALVSSHRRTVKFGVEAISNRGLQMWT